MATAVGDFIIAAANTAPSTEGRLRMRGIHQRRPAWLRLVVQAVASAAAHSNGSHGTRRARRRTATVLAVVVLALQSMLSPALAVESDRQALCHKPGTSSELTIEVLVDDVADHLDHGDTTGPCAPGQETVEYTCGASTLDYAILYVRSDAAGSMNGTIERPFGSVSAALSFARKKALAAVEVQVAPGTYGPDLATITGPTRLVGPGRDATSIAEMHLALGNAGAFDLGIQGLVFHANGSLPAMTIASPAGGTELCDVGFDGVVGHAISHTGGALTASDVVISATERDPLAGPEDHLTGTAIVLAGGVSASLTELHLTGSEGSGLHATGDGTVVDLDWEGSTESRIDTGSGCLGALVVNGGAALRSRSTAIEDNRLRGVHVDGAGTSAEFKFLTVSDTTQLEGGSEAAKQACGYDAVASVVVTHGPQVSVTGALFNPFTLSNAELVGVLIVGPEVPDVALSWGVIRDNPIAVAFTGFDPIPADYATWFGPFVFFTNNDLNVDFGGSLPPPQPLAEWVCDNGIDDDQDGLTDFDDPDCEGAPGAP